MKLQTWTDKLVFGYLEAVLFTEETFLKDDLGRTPDIMDFSEKAVKRARAICEDFLGQFSHLIDPGNGTQDGRDIWFTRNRHGTGFWDRDYEKGIGEALTIWAHSWGESYAYVCDVGKIHFSDEED